MKSLLSFFLFFTQVTFDMQLLNIPAIIELASSEKSLYSPEALAAKAITKKLDMIREQFLHHLKNQPWGAIVQEYIMQLEQEEQELLQELCKELHIKQEKLNHYLELRTKSIFQEEFIFKRKSLLEFFSEHLDNTSVTCPFLSKVHRLPIKPEQQKKINDFLQTYLLSLHDFEIIITDEQISAPAFAYFPYAIIISDTILSLPDTVLYVFLLHELTHLLFKDGVRSSFLKLNKNFISKDLIKRFLRFQEKRADTLACLADSNYACALAKFFSLYPDLMSDYLWDKIKTIDHEHPTPWERFKHAQAIMDKIKQDDNQEFSFDNINDSYALNLLIVLACITGSLINAQFITC